MRGTYNIHIHIFKVRLHSFGLVRPVRLTTKSANAESHELANVVPFVVFFESDWKIQG